MIKITDAGKEAHLHCQSVPDAEELPLRVFTGILQLKVHVLQGIQFILNNLIFLSCRNWPEKCTSHKQNRLL